MLYYGGWDSDNNHKHNLTSFQIDDNATWAKGKHTVKFGFKGRQEYDNVEELQQARGSHSFYADWTQLYDPSAQAATPFTGTGFASILLGLPTALRNQYMAKEWNRLFERLKESIKGKPLEVQTAETREEARQRGRDVIERIQEDREKCQSQIDPAKLAKCARELRTLSQAIQSLAQK